MLRETTFRRTRAHSPVERRSPEFRWTVSRFTRGGRTRHFSPAVSEATLVAQVNSSKTSRIFQGVGTGFCVPLACGRAYGP
jgi:hypothetical protein